MRRVLVNKTKVYNYIFIIIIVLAKKSRLAFPLVPEIEKYKYRLYIGFIAKVLINLTKKCAGVIISTQLNTIKLLIVSFRAFIQSNGKPD